MLYFIKHALKRNIPQEWLARFHQVQAIMANVRYGFPARKLKLIAVAGTKGKTTTTNLITHILESDGHKVAMLSTANFQIADEKWLNNVKLTTPSAGYVQRFLARARRADCEFAVLEASSHGMVQHRYWGVNFSTVLITNLTSDHLDYHKTFENYKKAHWALVTDNLRHLIINYDEPNTREILVAPGNYLTTLYGLKDLSVTKEHAAQLVARNIVFSENESIFEVELEGQVEKFTCPLLGEFNVYNALAAIAVCAAQGVPVEKIREGLRTAPQIPGRLEKIDEGQNFEVMVDYAHSPESLEKVYATVKPYVKGRLIAVLGGTGDRDKTYRAKGGALADTYADIVYVTNEDPYSEDIESIIDQVLVGIKNKRQGENLFRIVDRKEAIAAAIQAARKDDLVLITGKGCEQFMIIKDEKIPWDDREIARAMLRKIKS